jgi:hypothetical protein
MRRTALEILFPLAAVVCGHKELSSVHRIKVDLKEQRNES